MRDSNRVQDSCNRLNWGALDHASSAPQLGPLQLPHRVGAFIWLYISCTHTNVNCIGLQTGSIMYVQVLNQMYINQGPVTTLLVVAGLSTLATS